MCALLCPQLRYLVETPTNSEDPKRHFKYPFAACEIFCCEVEGIFNTLLENEDLLDQLFGILQVGLCVGWPSYGRGHRLCCVPMPTCTCTWRADPGAPGAAVQGERPLNCMLAGYFSRVMGSLLLRRTQEVMQYLQKHSELLTRMVEHVDTTSVAEVLVRLVGADEQRACLSSSQLQASWRGGAGQARASQNAG